MTRTMLCPAIVAVVTIAAMTTVTGMAFGNPAVAPATAQGAVTFASDIAPILYANCVTCHRPDGVGPFSLLTYDEARTQAEALADATARRVMPPWKPTAGHAEFQGTRRLTADEIDLFRRWAAAGTPEGDPTDGPDAPAFPSGWRLGEPDLVLSLDAPYSVESGSADAYRNFVLPLSLTERRWVRAVDVRPGTSGVVHHARVLVDTTGAARAADAEDPGPGYDGLVGDHGSFPRGHALNWAPGRSPVTPSDRMAWPLSAAADIVLQLHLRPGSEDTTVQPAVGFYFADQLGDVTPVSILLTKRTIDIPAGEANHAIEDRFRLPVAVNLQAVAPFAHHLATQLESRAILPDGGELTLLHIDDWDFDWLNEYRFVEPVHLPAGTIVTMQFTFDNSADNPDNPNSPPRAVRFGPTSHDERPELRLQVVPADLSDLAALERGAVIKSARDFILGYQARLRQEPTDHVAMTRLALRYLQVSERDLAIEQLQAAAGLAPEYAEAHYALGSAFVAKGLLDEATAAFRRTVEIKPDHGGAHNNLGGLMEAAGRLVDAEAHYRLAIQFDPGSADAQYNMGRIVQGKGNHDAAATHYEAALALRPDDAEVLTSMGNMLVGQRQYAAAVDHYQRALTVDPDWAASLVWLSWVRATAPIRVLRDGFQAVALAERAVAVLGEKSALLLDVLAAAYAADGQFDLAVSTAQEAAALARTQNGGEVFASNIDARANLYLAFTPFRMPAAEPVP